MFVRQTLPAARIDRLIDSALFAGSSHGLYRKAAKRAIDVTLVLIAALPVLLVLLVLAALIARDGASPVYFQKRVGRNGRVFFMWKLRSMVPNADRMLQDYLARNPEARREWDLTQKLRHDPRVTPIGRFIRKTSLDELPQLWNVLKGDMALVGPRPMMPEQESIYPGTAYYALRPGITGFWQTSVRNESSFSERAQYDTDYLRKLSLKTDLRVLWRTIHVVANGTGC